MDHRKDRHKDHKVPQDSIDHMVIQGKTKKEILEWAKRRLGQSKIYKAGQSKTMRRRRGKKWYQEIIRLLSV